ncbi:hypothetical protein EON62_01890 [archaeon]|nr:MAG: hypothetical protein EON62_01890 [archaeon]
MFACVHAAPVRPRARRACPAAAPSHAAAGIFSACVRTLAAALRTACREDALNEIRILASIKQRHIVRYV